MGERLVIGCMTGTSFDGVDAAAVRVEGKGLGMRAEFVCGESGGLGLARQGLREVAIGGVAVVDRFLEARHAYGEVLADVIERLVEGAGARPSLVAVHGQTVFHRSPLSWQVVEPWAIARRIGCPVVFDLRGADLSAGGEGAPITPLADWVLFRDGSVDRAVVNLGGFCNVTVVPRGGGAETVEGLDVCACNHVMDAAARVVLGRGYDEGGAAALRGRADEDAVDDLAEALRALCGEDRSLGSGDEGMEWVDRWRGRLGGEGLLASAAEGVGRVIGEVVHERMDADFEMLLAGGGARNRALAAGIERAAGRSAKMTDELGVPSGYREAVCMGVLGALAADGVCVTLAGVTGAGEPIPLSGAWVNARVNLDV